MTTDTCKDGVHPYAVTTITIVHAETEEDAFEAESLGGGSIDTWTAERNCDCPEES